MQRFSGELPPLPGVMTIDRELDDYDAYNNSGSKSARSSMTMGGNMTQEQALAAQVENVEAHMSIYAGATPAEPTADRVTAPPKDEEDDRVVTWDGPNDQTNPKNWSIPFKYLLSGLCCLCTLNV